jgi:prophage antirepressor-like protein
MRPISFKIDSNGKDYYLADELKEYHPLFFYGCSKTIRQIINRKNIPQEEYLFVNKLKNKWNIADITSKKAKLLISQHWIDKNQYFETKQEETKVNETKGDLNESLKDSFLDIRNNYFRYNGQDVFIIVKDNIAWFRGNDVAKLLEYEDEKNAIQYNVIENDKTDLENLYKEGRGLKMPPYPIKMDIKTKFINLEGVYDLIISSRKKEARIFRRWLSHEVLPSIHKFGYYSLDKKFGSFYQENDLFQYNDCNVCYIAHIGIHNQEPLFKFGITFDYHRREYQEHRKSFSIFELVYLRRTDNNRIVEDIFKKECLSKDLYRKIEKENEKNITELFTINETHSLERMMSIMNKIIEEHPTKEIKERDKIIYDLKNENQLLEMKTQSLELSLKDKNKLIETLEKDKSWLQLLIEKFKIVG